MYHNGNRKLVSYLALSCAMCALCTNAFAFVTNDQINHFNPRLPTLSAQELRKGLAAYEAAGGGREEAPNSTAPAEQARSNPPSGRALASVNGTKSAELAMKDPDFAARLAKGDKDALNVITSLSAEIHRKAGLPITHLPVPGTGTSLTSADQQNALLKVSKGNAALSAVLGQSLAMQYSQQSGGLTAPTSKPAPLPFPVDYNDAVAAVKLIGTNDTAGKAIDAVTINIGGPMGAFNVVDDKGPYKDKIKPLANALETAQAKATNK